MRMSPLERRLQILLDEERYRRVAAEADASGRSVAAVIREAIDVRFRDEGDAARIRSASELLKLTREPDGGAPEGPTELKEAYARHLDRAVSSL